MKYLFEKAVKDQLVSRINNLKPDTPALWGQMGVSQMLAHCCVSFEMVYENKHPRPNIFAKFLLMAFVKQAVVGPKPYPKNGRTAPQFKIEDQRNFELEQQRLIAYIQKTFNLGEGYFDGKHYPSFGRLTKEEWSTLFYKHIDHHLKQFGQ